MASVAKAVVVDTHKEDSLYSSLQNDGVITNLELDSNALRAEGARYIMEMLKTNTTIESLVTRHLVNEALWRLLWSHQWVHTEVLSHQNLSRNMLHLEGAKIVCNMLICNYFVKSIKLSGEQVTTFPLSSIAGRSRN